MRIFATAAGVIFAAAIAAQSGHAAALDRFTDNLERADANGDGVISRDEFLTQRAGNFQRFDRNRDGSISKSDFGRLARFRPEAAERLNQLIARADTNGDGRVTTQEHAAASARMFDRVDSQGDGVIDSGEVEALKAAIAARQ